MINKIQLANTAFYSSLFNNFGIEILFLTIILFSAITIFLSTKEAYRFSKHKGIKYFRNAFLFLAVAYTFRFLFYLLSYLYNMELINDLGLPLRMFGGGSILVYTFTSSVSLLSLLYALSYKKLEKRKIPEYSIYLISAIIGIVSFFMLSALWVIQILIATMIIFSVITQKSRKSKLSLGTAYISFSVFWILSIIGDIYYISALNLFRPVLYSILSIIILFILLRILKKT
jgi:hypothetical protein